MINFLITIILVLILVLVAIVHLFRLIFRFSHPYASTVIAQRAEPTQPKPDSGSAVGIFILILLMALAYLSFSNNHSSPITAEQDDETEQVTSKLNTPEEDESKDSKRATKPQSRSPDSNTDNEVKFRENESFRKIQTNDREIDRYNQSPKRSLPASFFSIQLSAFNDPENAQREAKRLGAVYNNLKLIYIEGPAPFKVILGPFHSRETAKEFQRKKKTGGYISLIDHQ